MNGLLSQRDVSLVIAVDVDCDVNLTEYFISVLSHGNKEMR